MSEPRWLTRARKYIGQREIYGKKHNPLIVRMWERIKAPFRDDETPWCSAFVGSTLELENIASTHSGMAKSWTRWGQKLERPAVGAIVVFWRGSPSSSSGHVGFVTGVDHYGNPLVLGGNQGDTVSISAFSKSRVLSYRWPPGEPLPGKITKQTSTGKFSTNEA